MPEYISSFATGFEEIINNKFSFVLTGARIIKVYDGLIRYEYNGNPKNINKIAFLNNSFCVIKFFNGNITFDKMVAVAFGLKNREPITNGTFRVRFTQENQFAKVSKRLSQTAETIIEKQGKLKINRLNPSTEFWYVIRKEGFGFYGQLLQKRSVTEKNLNKGELRPEFAYLMCLCAEYNNKSVIIDPFAGFGAIPMQIKKNFLYKKLIVNDLDSDKFQRLKSLFKQDLGSRISLTNKDALSLSDVLDDSVDYIITDPPWGYYEEICDIKLFYKDMLKEFRRIIKIDGELVILSARKEDFVETVESSDLFLIKKTLNVLVNGKKASVYILKPLDFNKGE